MAANLKLSAPDREFFALVAQTASCNPFSDQRLALDRQISGATPEMTVLERVRQLVKTVSDRVQQLCELTVTDVDVQVTALRQNTEQVRRVL